MHPFLAHEVAVFKMATIDHVNCCHLWQEDVVKGPMSVIDGSVAVPQGPGLGIELDRAQLEKLASAALVDKGRFLIRIRSAGGLTAYLRHAPEYFEELWQATADGPLWKEE